MNTRRPNELDEVNAFRAGFRHGQAYGIVSARQAEKAMSRLPVAYINDATVACFCNGAEDGAKGDTFRYLLSFTVAP